MKQIQKKKDKKKYYQGHERFWDCYFSVRSYGTVFTIRSVDKTPAKDALLLHSWDKWEHSQTRGKDSGLEVLL